MNLKQLGSNKTEIERTNADGSRIRILFSYNTPVAYSLLTGEGQSYYYTEEYYSETTTKHIKSWLPYYDAESVPQAEIDNLIAGVK